MRRDRAVRLHLRDERVTIKAIALQRDEAIADSQRTRVGVETIDWQRRIALNEATAAEARHFLEGATAHHAALLCRNSWTTRRSSKGWNWPAISCVVS